MRELVAVSVRRQFPQRTGRVIAGLAVFGMSVSLLAGCAGSSPADSGTGDASSEPPAALTKVRVGIVPATTWLPIIVADEQGIFEDHGLDVELSIVTSIPDPALGNQFDIIQNVGPNIGLAVLGGIDEVVVSNVAFEAETTTALMVGPDSDITSVADLAGKRIGVSSETSAPAQGLLILMEEEGLTAEDVTFQETPFPTMADQLSGGLVDAITPVEPFASQAEAAGGVRLVNPILEGGAVFSDGEPVVVGFVTALRSWVEENPEAVEAWRASLDEAIEFIASDEEAARTIFQEFSGVPEPVAQSVPFYTYDASPTSAAQLQVWMDILTQNGAIPADSDLDPADLVVP